MVLSLRLCMYPPIWTKIIPLNILCLYQIYDKIWVYINEQFWFNFLATVMRIWHIFSLYHFHLMHTTIGSVCQTPLLHGLEHHYHKMIALLSALINFLSKLAPACNLHFGWQDFSARLSEISLIGSVHKLIKRIIFGPQYSELFWTSYRPIFSLYHLI